MSKTLRVVRETDPQATKRQHSAVAPDDWRLFLDRILSGGATADDMAAVAAAFRTATYHQQPIEAALGFPSGWRAILRLEQRQRALLAIAGGHGSARSRARHLNSKIRRYASTRFRSDVEGRTIPTGDHQVLFEFLLTTGGAIPSPHSLRRWLMTAELTFGARDPLDLRQTA